MLDTVELSLITSFRTASAVLFSIHLGLESPKNKTHDSLAVLLQSCRVFFYRFGLGGSVLFFNDGEDKAELIFSKSDF